jgi:transposase
MHEVEDKTYTHYVGIDISKLTFDASILGSSHKPICHEEFKNTKAGYKSLLSWVKKLTRTPALYAAEATGPYSRPLLDYLYEHHHDAVQLEPKRVLYHRKAKGWEQKTDCSDSVLIADYVKSHNVSLYVPRLACYDALIGYTNDRRMLVSHRHAISLRQSCRLTRGKVLGKMITALNLCIKELDVQIKELVMSSPQMADDMALLMSIPGIGDVTASYFLAKIGDAKRFETSKAVVRYFGMNPCPQRSGSCKTYDGSISKMGDSYMRSLLYCGSSTVLKLAKADSEKLGQGMRDFVKELQHPNLTKNPNKQPKAKRVVRCAVMRKQLVLMWSVLISRQPYDPNIGTAQAANAANQEPMSDANGHVQDRAGAAPDIAGKGNDAGQDVSVPRQGCVDGKSTIESYLAGSGRSVPRNRPSRRRVGSKQKDLTPVS